MPPIRIDLTEADINNLLGALNAIKVQGEGQMLAVLTLAQKLREAARAAITPEPSPPAVEPDESGEQSKK